jgi:osmotically inducible lipoprotein OsmB
VRLCAADRRSAVAHSTYREAFRAIVRGSALFLPRKLKIICYGRGCKEMSMKLSPLFAVAAALLVAACGNTTGDRALSGAALGAGAGLAVGAVTGATLLEGAVVGGALGAAAGALTKSDQVNLGKPVWR